ncbi:MAG: redoxin domain-containing protein [Chloroflexi bacterium]|nr:redoxin domain-containing protein [Chloroflexota bacterium]
MAQVVAHQAEFSARGANIVTVSFDTPYWSHAWLQETQSPFPFLVDREHIAYRAYGLEVSRRRSWSLATLWYYAKAKAQKRPTFGKRGNPHQLGGDFIISPAGILRLAHPSQEPTDRPPLEQLLTALG